MAERYVTPEYADLYFQTKLNTNPWDTANYENRSKALYEATRIIDALPLIETKAVKDQVLRFPRTNQLAGDPPIPTVPTDVEEACCDIALALLADVSPEHEYNLLSRVTVGYATTRQQKDTEMVEPHIAAGIPSLSAWQKLLKYVRDYQSIKLVRDS